MLDLLQPCKPPETDGDGSKMLCRMPVVSLPDDLSQQLNNSQTGTINNTQGSGVAVYWASDGSVRADIYMGLRLDGFTGYQNVSSVDPDVKMQFSVPPEVVCEPEDELDFDPQKDKIITIKVNCNS